MGTVGGSERVAVLLVGAAAVVFERGPVSASDPVGQIADYFTDKRERSGHRACCS
jgi:hypothetical protein